MSLPAPEIKETVPVDESILTDEQIEQQLHTEPVPEKPDAPPEPSPEATPEKELLPAKKDEATETPVPEATQTETLYAGKYKTVDDLAKGLLEIAKPLGYNQNVIQRMIDLAKKTGDTTIMEESYKDMKLSLDRNEKAIPAKPEAPEAVPSKEDTTVTDTEQKQAAVEFQVIMDETYKALENHPLIQEMKDAGVEIPRTKADFHAMKQDHPYYAHAFGDLYFKTFQEFRGEVGEYRKALSESEPFNQTATESAKQQIKETLTQLKIEGIDDTAIDEAIKAALKTDYAYEDRHGVKFIRENGILEHFLAKEFPKLAKLIKTTSELEGRTQHLQDLKRMTDKSKSSISTTALPGKRQTAPAPIDVDDPSQVAALSDEDIQAHLSGKKPLK